MAAADKASTLFRSGHHAPPLLVLPSARDVRRATVLATRPGGRALATVSGGVDPAGTAMHRYSSDRPISRAPRFRVRYEKLQRTSTSRRFSNPIR